MTIPRLHLFELEDQPWFPGVVRDLATDYLHFVEIRLALHRPVVGLLLEALRMTKLERVVDLCSGGSGPVLWLHKALADAGANSVVSHAGDALHSPFQLATLIVDIYSAARPIDLLVGWYCFAATSIHTGGTRAPCAGCGSQYLLLACGESADLIHSRIPDVSAWLSRGSQERTVRLT